MKQAYHRILTSGGGGGGGRSDTREEKRLTVTPMSVDLITPLDAPLFMPPV